MEKSMCVFRCSACFFEFGDPHETSYFIYRKLLCHFSRFRIFCKKNIEILTPKFKEYFVPPKSLRIGPWGARLKSQTGPEFTSARPKMSKIAGIAESPDDPPRDILQERSTERDPPRKGPPRESFILRLRGLIL